MQSILPSIHCFQWLLQAVWGMCIGLNAHGKSLLCRNVKLGLVLLREAKRGQDSPWQLWIESLPHEVATLLHWTDKELQQLQLDSTSTEKQFYDQVPQPHADSCKLATAPPPP